MITGHTAQSESSESESESESEDESESESESEQHPLGASPAEPDTEPTLTSQHSDDGAASRLISGPFPFNL